MNKLEPPEEVIFVGYYLTEAREALRLGAESYGGNYLAKAFYYLTEANEWGPKAREALQENPKWMHSMPSDAWHDASQACIDLAQAIGAEANDHPHSPMKIALIEHKVGKAHVKLAYMTEKRLGYRRIRNADFKALQEKYGLVGGGGNR